MSNRNHWAHYKIHRQPVGVPNDRGITWSYPWQVTRPSAHPLMQGDNWELHAYKQFDTFENALRWATTEAVKDRLRTLLDELVDDNIDLLAKLAMILWRSGQ